MMIAIKNLKETDEDQYGRMDGSMHIISQEVEVSVSTATKSLRTLGKRSAS